MPSDTSNTPEYIVKVNKIYENNVSAFRYSYYLTGRAARG